MHLGPLTPVEVLYEFEGPCIFTASTPAGATVIAYLCETLEAQGWLRYLVASTSASTLDALKRGALSVRDALERGSLWLVDFDARMCPQHAFAIEAHALPDDALPAPNTMLWPSLEPAFIVKLEGTDISPGMLPPGALAQAADIASKALKPVLNGPHAPVSQTMARGCPSGSGCCTASLPSASAMGAWRSPSAPSTCPSCSRAHLRLFRGRIRDLDLDRLSLILRGVPDEASDILVTLDLEQLLEVAREAHYQELEVKVVARSTDGRNWIATELEFAAPYADIPSETTPWGASGGQGAP